MKEILLAKYGELALKGLNKGTFESALLKTVRRRMEAAGNFKVYKAQSTVYIEPLDDDADVTKAFELLSRVFGLSAIDRALVVEKDFDKICTGAAEYLAPVLREAKTFKVSAKRSDKRFPLDSMQIGKQLGDYLGERFPHLEADMKHPDARVVVEVRDFAAYVHSGNRPGAGGMPTGTSGRAAVLLSGGIDSPVAAYMMAKRGLDLIGIHFMSPPYTSERALDKAARLAGLVSRWCGNLPLLCVPFTDIQLAIRDNGPEELFTVLMRRSMMRVANLMCAREQCRAIITGESLAQVASQTLGAIACTDAAADVPVLRPLIGMDKTEIVAIAERIGTFETSIEPYEDCCTIFTPKHPKTKPQLAEIERAEDILNLGSLEKAAAGAYTVKMQHFYDFEA
ncbi:MAG: tRNA uracil 4-sulfurtransferase ThiI [Oscillospiraceae bacterium]|nr:tRNA uracil 4-sulfurtransferase ThiI [Oscillospiraceae bacterium]